MSNEEQNTEEELFGFEKLEVYNRAVDLADKIMILTMDFPKRVQNSVVYQLNRSVLSISLNIAEGSSNFYTKSRKRYLRIAKGSAYECIPTIRISKKQGFITQKIYTELYKELFEISCMISGLIKSIENRT
jgi:four helix bundle protein